MQILVADVSLDQDSGILEGSPQEDEHGPNRALQEASGSINGMDYEVTQSNLIKLYLFKFSIFIVNGCTGAFILGML